MGMGTPEENGWDEGEVGGTYVLVEYTMAYIYIQIHGKMGLWVISCSIPCWINTHGSRLLVDDGT